MTGIKRRIFRHRQNLRKMLGVGPLLLLLGALIEGVTIIARQHLSEHLPWLSIPVRLSQTTKIILTIPLGLAFFIGMLWINRWIRRIGLNILNGRNELLIAGPFAFVRHPLYAALILTLPPLLIIWFADLFFLVPWILITLVSHPIVAREERRLVTLFGEAYLAYRRTVPALIPYKGAAGNRLKQT